jgi:alanine dehydrogenase
MKEDEMKSLILTCEEVLKVMDMNLALEMAGEAFRAYGEGRVNMPPKAGLALARGEFASMFSEVTLPTGHICGNKWICCFPDNPRRGLLTVMGKIVLNDVETGEELASMDGTYITNYRTGAAGGLGAQYLAKPEASRLGLVGAGEQARTQVAAIVRVRPIREITIYSRTPERARGLQAEIQRQYGLAARITDRVEEAVRGQDIVVTVTPSTTPLVRWEWVEPGTHINAFGADAVGKQELDPAILGEAKVVVDDVFQAMELGEINVAVSRGLFRHEQIYATLGEVVVGKKAGRTSPGEITLFDATGLSVQDLTLAYAIYRRALERNLGEARDFLHCRLEMEPIRP